ncbi:MAG: hypothetical protein KC441_04870, partial [Anaerolineales bacterium]|nr:hypothetical protein [Anaerolineales bacterium]
RSDGIHVRLIADHLPTAAAKPVTPTLEDAYLDAVQLDGWETAVPTKPSSTKISHLHSLISNKEPAT